MPKHHEVLVDNTLGFDLIPMKAEFAVSELCINGFDESRAQVEEKVSCDSVRKEGAITHLDEDMRKARARFENQFPECKKLKDIFKKLRETEFSYLDRECTYLDFTGAALAPRSLLEDHFAVLTANLLGNPHSAHEPSLKSTNLDEAARKAVLSFCNADPDVFTVIWTGNSSGALKLVGQSYPFSKSGAFVYAPDCHNSVLGISEFAKRKGAGVRGFKFGNNFASSYDYDDLENVLDGMSKGASWKPSCMPRFARSHRGRLLAVPAQSNVSGAKHCTQRIIDAAHSRGWDVLLDTAALAPTSRIDFSSVQPEFACLSFYKLFGYPTGIGCLVAKKSALARLERTGFAGGTVRAVSAQPEHLFHLSYDKTMPQAWEDGTINFQQTSAVQLGLQWLQRVGMDNVRAHTSGLISWLSAELRALRWDNGAPFCFIPEVAEGEQGSTVSMLVLTRGGQIVPHKVVEAKTVKARFAVRTGCFCNPGTGYLMLGWHDRRIVDGKMLVHNFTSDYAAFADVYKTLGLVRISAGIPTTFEELYSFLSFLKHELLCKPQELEDEVEHFVRTVEMPYSFC